MFPKTEANISKNRIMFLKRFYNNHVSKDFRKLATQMSKRNPRLEIKNRLNPKIETMNSKIDTDNRNRKKTKKKISNIGIRFQK